MAILKVVFPHHGDDGKFYLPGDYREVPEELLDFYLRPDLRTGQIALVQDPDAWKPVAGTSAKPIELRSLEEQEQFDAPVEDGEAQLMVEPEEGAAEDEAPKKKGKK